MKYKHYYESYTLYIKKSRSKEFKYYKERLKRKLDKENISMGDWFIEQIKKYLKK